MGNKILVEFDKARIKEWCKLQRIYPNSYCPCSECKQSDKEQIECMLMEGSLYIETDYKIKEQNNEIKPKFKVGDKVYYNYFGEIREFTIVDIIITENHIYYRDEYEWNVDEKECFSTQAEAQAECERRIDANKRD